jgi:hypothetical protein
MLGLPFFLCSHAPKALVLFCTEWRRRRRCEARVAIAAVLTQKAPAKKGRPAEEKMRDRLRWMVTQDLRPHSKKKTILNETKKIVSKFQKYYLEKLQVK